MSNSRRSIFLCHCLFAFQFQILSLSAQTNTRAQKAELAGSNPVQAPIKIDRRYAVFRGNWSAATTSLFNTWSAPDDNPGRHMFLYSPDRKKITEVAGEDAVLDMDGKTFQTDMNYETKHDAELGWSPDSSKYFVTWTKTGELGPWHMQVYAVDESGSREFPKVEQPARSDFERRVRRFPIDEELDSPEYNALWESDEYCEPYHVIGGRWLNGSKEILLSVLNRNTSDCRYMSEFNVYRVKATTGEILERFTARQAHKHFGGKYLPLIVR